MKQEFVALPREVVEQAIAALTDLAGWRAAPLCDLLRAALEQPQNHVPDVGSMVQAGWKSVPVEPTQEMMRAWVTEITPKNAWASMLDAAPQQPQGEQEPVATVNRLGTIYLTQAGCGMQPGTRLYTHPQPKRDPLTDEQIEKICPSFDDPMRREMWKIGFKTAHGIK